MTNRICFLILFLGLGLLSSGCAKSGSTSADTTASTCSTGYVYSSTYGCLAQSSCPTGYGLYNNQCILVSSATTCASGYVYSSTYGCLPQGTCGTGYALYGNQCVYVGSTTLSCPTGYMQSGSTCVLTNSTTYSSCQGSCPVGYAQTVYGCLPQGNCMSCYGAYGKYCMGAAVTGYRWYLNFY